jgi:hypothetical protein
MKIGWPEAVTLMLTLWLPARTTVVSGLAARGRASRYRDENVETESREKAGTKRFNHPSNIGHLAPKAATLSSVVRFEAREERSP